MWLIETFFLITASSPSLSVQLAGLGWDREHGWTTAGEHQQPAEEETSLAQTGHSHNSDVTGRASHFCSGVLSCKVPPSLLSFSFIIFVVTCADTFHMPSSSCSRWRGRGSCAVSACQWRPLTSSPHPETSLTPGGLSYNASHPSLRP